jgi:aspartate/methionine/tyrosine aminotransferase
MPLLHPFELEDFFDEFEHRRDLINLASSDALPWGHTDLDHLNHVGTSESSPATFAYPDWKALLLEGLRNLTGAPPEKAVLPTAGGAEAISIVMHALICGNGARSVALPVPGYKAFEGLASLLGIKVLPYYYRCEETWQVDTETLRQYASDCSAIIIVNPHNPTGKMLEISLLDELARLAAVNGGALVVDEVLAVPGEAPSAVTLAHDNVVVIGSLSKTYGLPGLRAGWIVATAEHVRSFRTIQQYITLSPSSVASELTSRVLRNPSIFSRASLIQANRSRLTDWANAHSGSVRSAPLDGGTTAFVQFPKSSDERELFHSLLANGVLLAPGRFFGNADNGLFFRLGYGASPDRLDRGLDRVLAAVS